MPGGQVCSKHLPGQEPPQREMILDPPHEEDRTRHDPSDWQIRISWGLLDVRVPFMHCVHPHLLFQPRIFDTLFRMVKHQCRCCMVFVLESRALLSYESHTDATRKAHDAFPLDGFGSSGRTPANSHPATGADGRWFVLASDYLPWKCKPTGPSFA